MLKTRFNKKYGKVSSTTPYRHPLHTMTGSDLVFSLVIKFNRIEQWWKYDCSSSAWGGLPINAKLATADFKYIRSFSTLEKTIQLSSETGKMAIDAYWTYRKYMSDILSEEENRKLTPSCKVSFSWRTDWQT